ncbi:MAG: Transglutaminase-like superfamily protein [Methanomassiliicoccales archaeon PtaU1.Bin124]|nr:MAG: Transglutaminase-like superfamily protein [Methanomassiliicoccales archaeon PtaU1.Bin124]
MNILIGLAEMKDKEYIPTKVYMSLLIRGTFSLGKIILLNMRELKRLRVIPEGSEHYVQPPKQYQIPEYKEGMRSCRSEEKYLRPTLYCDPNDPIVVALANELGAFQVSDREFAERAFKFVKDKLLLNERQMNEVGETFQRGSGTCFHLITAFIALCRCAGIKARYKIFAMKMIPSWYDVVIQPDPFIKKWYDSLGYFVLEGEGEVFLDGEWVVANVTPEADWQAATGTPINKLGEDSLGNWYNAVPGTEMILESMPYGLAFSLFILHTIAPGSMERVNINIEKQKERGREIIDASGGLEEYDRRARARQGPKLPKVELEPMNQIIFDK